MIMSFDFVLSDLMLKHPIHVLMFSVTFLVAFRVQQDTVSQSLDQEVLLKVKTEIEEELKSLDKEISEGLFILIS